MLIYSIRSGHYTSLRPLLCKKPQPNWTLWWPWLDATIEVISGNFWARTFFDQAMQEGRGIRSIKPRAPIMCTITLGDTPPLRPLPSQLWESQFSPPPPPSNSSIQKIGNRLLKLCPPLHYDMLLLPCSGLINDAPRRICKKWRLKNVSKDNISSLSFRSVTYALSTICNDVALFYYLSTFVISLPLMFNVLTFSQFNVFSVKVKLAIRLRIPEINVNMVQNLTSQHVIGHVPTRKIYLICKGIQLKE